MEIKQVSQDEDGIRLDRWFKINYPHIAHSLLQKLLRKGVVRIDGKRAKSDTRVSLGQNIKIPNIEAPTAEEMSKPPQKLINIIKNSIIYEDDDIIVVNKPNGLATQGGTKVKNSVDDILSAIYPQKPKLVHRLDKDTSGILLVAKNRKTAEEASLAFKNRETKKIYIAIVNGSPVPKKGEISAPLLKYNDKKMIVDEKGKEAITKYNVISSNERFSALELQPLTGRTHQLRVHCSHIGHPILGDDKYGEQNKKQTLCLHAKTLEITIKEKKHTFKAKIPEHILSVVDI